MGRKRTRNEIKVIQGNYGYGWDDLVCYEFTGEDEKDLAMHKELRDDYKSYLENEVGYQHRIITRYAKKENLL